MILVIFFILALAINFVALRKINLANMTFIDGVIIGMAYYLTIPMIVVMLSGRIGGDFLPIPDYRPYEDVTTTIVLFTLIFMMSAVRAIMPRRKNLPRESRAYSTKLVLGTVVGLYFATTVIGFYMSGISSGGGHWFRSGHAMMHDDARFLLLKVVSNYARTAVFGCLVAMSFASNKSRRTGVLIGAAVCLTDLMLTFNRICIVYFMIYVVIAYRKHMALVLGLLGITLVGGVYVSNLFTEVRGLVSAYGYTPAGFTKSIEVAISHADDKSQFVDRMNGVFESMNITTFNYVVENQTHLDVPFGSYFVRPLTILIPRKIIPSRPEVFGVYLGRRITGSRDSAVNSTLIGEPYANAVYFWPVMLLAMVFLYHYFFLWLSCSNNCFGSIGAFVAFAFWRFDSSFAATAALLTLIIHVGLLLAVKGRRDFIRVAGPRRRAGVAPRPVIRSKGVNDFSLGSGPRQAIRGEK